MANQEHLDILHQGVDTWNEWRQQHPGLVPDLDDTNLSGQHLEGADLSEAHMKEARLRGTYLNNASLSSAHLEGADLSKAYLEGTDLGVAHLEGAILKEASLKRTNLKGAHLEGSSLERVYLEDAFLDRACLQGASLKQAHLEGASLERAHLEGADFREAFCSNTTRLHEVTLGDDKYGSISLADVSWNGVNLAVVKWTSVKVLGDEQIARQAKALDGTAKYTTTRIEEHRTAVRANRQLVVVLREQGLNEEADHFAYRAQILQRTVWRLQRKPFKYVFSWFLALLAGYGYEPVFSLYAYLLTVMVFAVIYYLVGRWEHPPILLSYSGALFYSLTSFHGRGFFPGPSVNTLDNPLIGWAACEAVVGLLIEISLIATFTQRFFGK